MPVQRRQAGLAACIALAAAIATCGADAKTTTPKGSSAVSSAAHASKAAASAQLDASDTLSPDAKTALARILTERDNTGAPFVVIDKRRARAWVFDGVGHYRGSTPVLLGFARGDDTVPGIGDKPLAQVKPGERTTPAGRFVAEHGRNARGDTVLWVDYDAAVSMHRVHDVHATDRRLQRLRTPPAADNRISYGCINVPVAFFEHMLMPTVGSARPVVYVLPETRPVATLFDSRRAANEGS
jgi:hypothetical protein